MSSEHLCLKWNNFENNITSYLDILRNENDFVDVTITCGEKNFKAHKVILSACSPYFKGIFQENPCRHPVIILKNVSAYEMEAIMQYIYTGETYITKDDLSSFLDTANLLQIIGLINYNTYSFNHSFQNGPIGHKNNDSSQIHSKPKSFNNFKSQIVVKNFAKSDEVSPNKKPTSGDSVSPKRKSSGSDSDQQTDAPSPNTEESCPILSKQLLLPKKRKLSVVDQNKNVEFYDNSELSNSSEETKESSNILRGCLGDRTDQEGDTEDAPTFPNVFGIKKETPESENVLEPEVGLSIKEENDFESTSEESLHNGDILLQRLQSYQDCKAELQLEHQEEHLKIPKPDVSIFSKKFKKGEGEGENLTLTPNVEIFLRNANNSSDNLIHRLANINLFKSKNGNKKLRKGILPKPEVIPGTSKCEKDPLSVKNGIGSDSKTFHLTNLPCPHCRQEYNNLSALKYHVRLMHSDLENKLFCYLCPMNFIEREYFKIHLWEAHNARF